MASTDAKPVPQKNVAYRHYFDIRKNDGTLITGWTGADSEVSKDGAAFADCTNEATEIGTSGCGYIDLTSTEVNADSTFLKVTVTNTDAMPYTYTIYPEEAGDIRVNMQLMFGSESGVEALDSLMSVYAGNGYVPASLDAVRNVALTESTAGNLAGAFSYVFNTAAPAFTAESVNQTGNSYAIVNDGTNGNAAIKTQLGSMAGATFNTSTDSLEAIRDRGDAAWVTGGGGGLDAAGVRAAIGLASANLDTQLADLPTVAEFEARTIVAADYFVVGDYTAPPSASTISTQVATDLQAAHGSGAWTTADVSGLATAANLATVAGYLDTEIAAILADTNELQTNQGNWLTATGFATPTNVSDAQTAIIAQVDANETKIDALTTTVGVAGAGLSALPWNADWNAEVQSEVADALNASPPVDGSGVGIYSVAYAALALTHSNRSSATTLLVKSANGTTIGTHTLTEDDTLDPVSVVGDGS